MTELTLTALFLLYTAFREWQHAKEVKLLSEAIIAKNIYEYKDAQSKSSAPEQEKPPRLIPIDDASDEDFLRSIKKQLKRQTPQDKFREKIKKIWPKK